MQVVKSTVPQWYTGQGTAPSRLPPYSASKYVLVRADLDNPEPLQISPGGAEGFLLAPGKCSPSIPVDRADKVLVSGTGGYSFFVI